MSMMHDEILKTMAAGEGSGDFNVIKPMNETPSDDHLYYNEKAHLLGKEKTSLKEKPDLKFKPGLLREAGAAPPEGADFERLDDKIRIQSAKDMQARLFACPHS